ncbi:MAG: TRAFs-binding domain-containing protein [Pseudomonadota bacterium]
MPFGKKVDPHSGMEIDFDMIYDIGIRPAIEAARLVAIRADQETSGGIIHKAMFARLLLAEFVVADMTTANANVFYELGIRHAAKPQTTIPIFATVAAPPFDVNLIRAIPYDLRDNGRLSDESAYRLIAELSKRIDSALTGPVSQDSPLFSLFPEFPGIEMSHELTDVFRDRVDYSRTFRDALAEARSVQPRDEAVAALKVIEDDLGDPLLIERGVLIDLFLSYRSVEAWDEMVALYDRMPAVTRDAALCRQQAALALNRRNGAGDRNRAMSTIRQLIDDLGPSAESYGMLGRIYKDMYAEAQSAGSARAGGYLDLAIEAYNEGFETEPSDFYPGTNAITLLLKRDRDGDREKIDYLAPLVTFAAVRRGGERSDDYWTVATVMELAVVSRDYDMAERCLNRAVALPGLESWMLKTTRNNLTLASDSENDPAALARIRRLISLMDDVIDETDSSVNDAD